MIILVGSAILFPVIVYFMPKMVNRVYLYAATGMATYFQLLVDVFLHIKLNWYGYFAQIPKSEWETMWLVPLYLSITPLFLNFYPYDKSWIRITSYIIGWSIFAVVYEWALVQTGVFYHNDWRLYHSAIAYPFLFILLRAQLGLIRILNQKDHSDSMI